MAEWLTIEVFDGDLPASRWRESHGEALLLTALTNGGTDWAWHEHRWVSYSSSRSMMSNAAMTSRVCRPYEQRWMPSLTASVAC